MIGAGDRVALAASGRSATLVELLGEGSQGAVFEAVADDGERLAVKWYLPRSGTEGQRNLVADLVDRGAPDDRFLWPLEMVSSSAEDGFGYVMRLRPDDYAGLAELLKGKVDVGFSVVCRLSIELADAFLQLHIQGLCYRDISFSNVFFDPESGRPLICDNDNVGVDGASITSVLGTRKFMAPEIVRREANPSAATDLYSLSVLLFYVLVMGHPLLGRRELDYECWDDVAESELFGRSPLFVFDPTDGANAPAPDLHAAVIRYWALYPPYIRDLFVQAFTEGLREPVHGRVRESMWRSNLARLRDSIVRCGNCCKEVFVHLPGRATVCWFCDREVTDTLWLQLGRRQVGVAEGAQVTAHHLRGDYDFETVVATMVRHPVRADLLGLRNDTDEVWSAVVGDEEREVPPGRSLGLVEGTSLTLGSCAARVVTAHQR